MLARELELFISHEDSLELLAPITLNIVCFRFVGVTADEEDLLNR